MMISEIFESIQGEGPYVGLPCGFVRVAGCNYVDECPLDCDTKYAQDAENGREMTVKKVIEQINLLQPKSIVFTGGEPTIYWDEIIEIMDEGLFQNTFHIETNGVINFTTTSSEWRRFESIVISPKTITDIFKWVKVIKDLKMNNTWLKVVVWNKKILEGMRTLWMNDRKIAKEKVFLMPHGWRPEDVKREFKRLMDWEIKNGIGIPITPRLQILFGVL